MLLLVSPRRGPGHVSTAVPAMRLGVIVLSLLAGGCAASTTAPSRVAGPTPREPAVKAMKIEVEDDGLPSQLAPRHRRPMPDEPAEPWSPNYGSSRAAALNTERLAAKLDAEAARVPAPARSVAPHARPIDADDIIRRAIAEHEIRQR